MHLKMSVALEKRGLSVWLDADQMKGDIVKKMCEGIDNAQCVVVFLTQRYMEKVTGLDGSDNCQKEFNYADLKKTSNLMVNLSLHT